MMMSQLKGATGTSPFRITLGHEMAHSLANVQGVKFNDCVTIKLMNQEIQGLWHNRKFMGHT